MAHSQVALAALPTRIHGLPARYALELRPEQDPRRVTAQVLEQLAGFDPTLAPISPTDDRVLLLDLGTRTLEDADPATAFAAGYALADDVGLRTAEPDLPTPYFPEVDPAAGAAPGEPETEAVRLPFGCWVDEERGLSAAWALDRIHAQEAWAFSASEGRPARGRGIVIAQPDTGVIAHPELSGVPRRAGFDVLDNDSDPTDPLTGINPGHGTATASVVVSPVTLRMSGSAPEATHMPIRAIRSVVQVSQVSVAAAIERAVLGGADVITMSLGGIPTSALQRAVRRAVAADVIVLAAAGNCVGSVVWPARYEECLAVAGTNAADQMWRGSCRGPAVDVSAPGQNVFKAASSGASTVSQGQGTSFAVALTAGVAALWLAHHGRDHVIAAAHVRGERVQDMFRRLVRATARRPAGWNSFELGAGIVDAAALLRADFDLGLQRVSPEAAVHAAQVQTVQVHTTPRSAMAGLVAEVAGSEAVPAGDFDWKRYGPELANGLLRTRMSGIVGDVGVEGDERGPWPESAPSPHPGAAQISVSESLSHAISNPHLRDRLGLGNPPDSME